ncbi:energy transducer TonB [Epilithonimonas zeae]|uniref:TonB protein C-terminal n=1 Tax=Epilithonimonas zeae TaxID=1416779 RepID=A0A1N6IPB1_9FLAO|nr:energy transducer TonB [Epilithonimonas zeae]SIO33850.1 TonB protein C-terminal [Epilithonimonas zeae]
MKKILLLFVLLFSVTAFSQEKNENEVFEAVDKAATFEGGISSFRNEFAKNVDTKKVQGKGTFRTVMTFVVEKDGTISELKANGENQSFNEQAVKAMKKIKTKWSPAKKDGTTVRSRFKFPAAINI